MGNGIAQSLATGGYDVTLIDAFPEALARAIAGIEQQLAQGVSRGKLTQADSSGARARISTAEDIAKASTAQLVIEAVPEELGLKHDIFRRLEEVCAPDTVLATNTSALSITEIAASTTKSQGASRARSVTCDRHALLQPRIYHEAHRNRARA